jgi:hypothetical protein
VDYTAIHEDFDFELLGIFDATRFQWLATMRADLLLLGQIKGLLPKGPMAGIAASRSVLIRLPPPSSPGLIVRGVVEFIGAVGAGLLLGAASLTFGLQLADLAAELFVLLLQRRDWPDRIGMSAPPVSGLLSPFEILTPQVGHLGAQRIDFRQEPRDQRGQIGKDGGCLPR